MQNGWLFIARYVDWAGRRPLLPVPVGVWFEPVPQDRKALLLPEWPDCLRLGESGASSRLLSSSLAM